MALLAAEAGGRGATPAKSGTEGQLKPSVRAVCVQKLMAQL